MRRTRRPEPKRLARRVSWSRRIGVAGALVLLVGGAIAFASQGLDGGRATKPAPGAPPPPAPILLAPVAPITSTARIDLQVIRPQGLRQDQQYRLRVYVNDQQVRERNLPDTEQFAVEGVPLVEGDNAIRATLVGDGGESDRSASVAIVRDDIAPVIRVTRPGADEKVYLETTTLAGRTEPGADITIVDPSTGHEIESSIGADGHFSATLTLDLGSNPIVLRSTDAAGNRSSTRVNIVRSPNSAHLALTVTPTEIFAADLPATVLMNAAIRDELGRPIDGAQVTFSVSPPDRETMVYRATSSNGRARWTDLVIDTGDAHGVWLVTARAVLPSGIELREDGSFSLE